jgi:4-amino-4-deoxy-L-arabinose transferase-like glycosyltransferase
MLDARTSSGSQLQVSSLIRARSGLLLIFLAALSIRAVCCVLFSGEIDAEGAEYARIAQNLLAGKGYVGIGMAGTQLFFPPLYPFLIAGVTVITGDAEISARIINIVMGALLACPVYLIGRRMFDESKGLGAAALVAFHPYLVWLSTTVRCESTYYILLMTALFSAMYAIDKPTVRAPMVSGGLYALAYLVRPEAFIFMLVGTAYILLGRVLAGHRGLLTTVSRVSLMPIVFLVVAGPYIGWLSLQTGQLRIEGKSVLNVATELRIQKGLSVGEATVGVDADLTPRGPSIQPNIDVIKSYHIGIKESAIMIAKKLPKVASGSSAAIVSLGFGAPALFVLAVLGLFDRPWRPRLALDQLHWFALLSLSVFAVFFIYYADLRFYILFLLFFCIWAPVGLARLMRWAQGTACMLGAGRNQQAFFGSAVQILAVAAVIAASVAWASMMFSQARGTRAFKAVAVSFATSNPSMRVADTSTYFAFHAHAANFLLPYCDEVTALRYLEKMRVTHIIVRDQGWYSTPYLKKWMDVGVPNTRQIVGMIAGNGERIHVYEIQRPTP